MDRGFTVEIVRYRTDKEGTFGICLIHGTNFRCNSLELPWKKNRKNVSCIPVGIYRCEWNYSNTFKRKMYMVTEVTGRSGIRIHVLNTIRKTLGCIGLGDHLLMKAGLDRIYESTQAIDEFEKILNQSEFTLVIRNLTEVDMTV